MAKRVDGSTWCDVCWGSHACKLELGHAGHHVCCCDDPERHWRDEEHPVDEIDGDSVGLYCAGTWPYYGPVTRFYGEDVPEGWLRVKVDG